jgi:opine dehydrogenase
MTPAVAVVGAGVGGLAVAGRSALRGCTTSVVDIDASVVDAIGSRGGIEVRGREEGFAPIAAATTDAGEVIGDVELVIVCVQASQLAEVARTLDPLLRADQVVLVKPGCTGGALAFRNVASRARGLGTVIAETDAFAFGCSMPSPGVAQIGSVKRSFAVASLPAAAIDRALELVRAVFPEARRADSVLHTGLSNMNAVLHVAPMIANVGRIESGEETFDFYGEGVTPGVARVMAAHDRERLAVATALGIGVSSLSEWIAATYGVESDDLHAGIAHLSAEVYGPVRAPATLEHRFLTEDVEYGAVPIADLGRQLRVDVSVTAHSVTLASALLGRDLQASGRTVGRLGLAGLAAAEIAEAVL